MSAVIEYEGLRDLVRALRAIESEVLPELERDMRRVGDVVRDDARRRFEHIDAKTAAGFDTRVRMGAGALVIVGQSLRKTTGRRPDYGARQMRDALLPARAAKHAEAVQILEAGAGRLLHEHGF